MADRAVLRTFFALVPDSDALAALSARIDRVRALPWARELRWIAPENLHLTLRFLGPTPADVVDAMVTELPRALSQGAFRYCIDRISLFPNPRRPRIVAAEIADNEALQAVAADLEQLAVRHEFAPEKRPFRGHLTLARARRSFPKGAHLEEPITPVEAIAAEITYYSSDTLPSGAVYTPIAVVPLPGN